MKGNALLVGGTGFVGTHMQRALEPEYNVIATGRSEDIKSKEKVDHLVSRAMPDVVVNLASITTVRETFEDPEKTYQIGFYGTLNLLAALKEYGFKGRMLNISSSEVYGFPKDDQLPITEEMALSPMSPYSVSKIAAEALCYQWSQTESFEILTARPFTHIGPGQSDRFSISNFAKQIAEIMLGRKRPVMRAGSMDTTRDFTDVRDVVRAYILLLDQGRNGGVYNVCSGRESHMRVLLDTLIEHSGLSITVEEEQSLTRDKEQLRICGSYERLYNDTGWRPEIPLPKSLSDILEYWVEKVRCSAD